ncbi:retinitis pigmentosa 1-like 1 protein [Thomomys bottae]
MACHMESALDVTPAEGSVIPWSPPPRNQDGAVKDPGSLGHALSTHVRNTLQLASPQYPQFSRSLAGLLSTSSSPHHLAHSHFQARCWLHHFLPLMGTAHFPSTAVTFWIVEDRNLKGGEDPSVPGPASADTSPLSPTLGPDCSKGQEGHLQSRMEMKIKREEELSSRQAREGDDLTETTKHSEKVEVGSHGAKDAVAPYKSGGRTPRPDSLAVPLTQAQQPVMNSTPSHGRAPSLQQRLLLSSAGTPSVTNVTPAKKITFFKRGDPQCAGVRVAVHQRAFRTFSALMDELSQRMPLSFGVRSVTTPRGLHDLSTLEQLQDGGCYLCSDRKPPKTPRGPGRPPGRSSSALQSGGLTGGCEIPGASPWKGATAPRRVTLVKNGDPRSQKSMVLSHRNTRSLTAFLSRASELLRFPVKQLYTTSGEKVDCLQALLQSPSVLVCAGNEALRPVDVEDAGKNKTGTLSELTSQRKNGCWGPKTKQSVIHLRSRSGGKPPKFSLLSAKTGHSDHPSSGNRVWVGPVPHSHPQDTHTHPGPLVAGDNVEKNVHMNEDGSLSVEMKIRFQLVGEDALLWSQRMGRASAHAAASGEGLVPGDANPLCCRAEGHPGGLVESGAQALAFFGAGCQGAYDRDWQAGCNYDIWKNPLCKPQEEKPAPRRTWGPIPLSHCRRYWRQGTLGRNRHDEDSISPASSAENADTSEPDSCDPRAPGSGDSLRPASASAAQSKVEQEAGTERGGSHDWGPCGCLGPRTRGVARALSDLSANTGSPEETSKGSSQHPACRSLARTVASQRRVPRDHSPRTPILSPSSLSNMDLQAEKCGQGARARKQTSGDTKPPSLGSQDLAEAKKAITMSMSNSDGASGSPRPSALSEEPVRYTKSRAHSSAPTPAHGRGASSLGNEAASAPRPSPSSALLDGWPDGGEAGGGPHNSCYSLEDLDQAQAISEACWERSSYFPTPPGEPPQTEKHHSSCSNASVGQQRADDGAGHRRGQLRTSPSAEKSLEGPGKDPGTMPSTLPHSLPEAIVREWLGNIPEAPVLMGYEMVGKTTNVTGSGPEDLNEDDPGDSNRSLKGLVELAQARQQPSEGGSETPPEPADAPPVTSDEPHQDNAPGEVSLAVPAEAGEGEGGRGCHGGSLYDLPGRVSASTQIMKALMGIRQDRPSSLPEVSSPVVRRLCRSAGTLISCLARLHFFDEDLGSLAGQARLQGFSGYQELLSISQALWPGCGLEQGHEDADCGMPKSFQALPMTEGFTLTSSSGVDVSSGSGGSGEGSMPCAIDRALVPEKVELPPNASQRPDSRALRYHEDLGATQSSHSTSSASSQEAEGDSQKQEPHPAPEQFIENTVQDNEVPLEETEGGETQGEGVEEERKGCQQDVSGASCGDREGSEENGGMLGEESGRNPTSAGLCPLGRAGRPAEPSESSGDRDSSAQECPGSSHLEAGLEELPKGTRMEPVQALSSPGTGMAYSQSLDPDPIWVSKLLKKMEKAFLAHLAGATARLRARWNLQDDSQLDQMVAELEREVGLRLRESTDQELRKVQSRAGRAVLERAVPGPPRGTLWGQASLQTEQRRRRLWGLHNLSVFPEPNHDQGLLAFTPEDHPTCRTATDDEFCPCHACARKKAALLCPSSSMGATGAPIRKAFDLQQILQKKKEGGLNGEAEAPERTGAEPAQEQLSRTVAVQGVEGGRGLGLSPGPAVGKGEGEEENQRLSGREDPEPQEAEGTECLQEREEEEEATSVLEMGQGSEDGDAGGGQAEEVPGVREEGQMETEEGPEAPRCHMQPVAAPVRGGREAASRPLGRAHKKIVQAETQGAPKAELTGQHVQGEKSPRCIQKVPLLSKKKALRTPGLQGRGQRKTASTSSTEKKMKNCPAGHSFGPSPGEPLQAAG